MKLVATAVLVCLTVLPSQAGVLTCEFTEPFFSINFDSRTGQVTRISADHSDPDTGKPIPEILATAARLSRTDVWQGSPSLLLREGETTLLEVKMTQGSDGMSEAVYPLEGRIGNNVGGCETDTVQAFDMYQLLIDLGVEQ